MLRVNQTTDRANIIILTDSYCIPHNVNVVEVSLAYSFVSGLTVEGSLVQKANDNTDYYSGHKVYSIQYF